MAENRVRLLSFQKKLFMQVGKSGCQVKWEKLYRTFHLFNYLFMTNKAWIEEPCAICS